ncbi:MAG: hypothetical protein M3144_09955 [Actinomycetota bacterium]|nr:hypothetical protein [Actinomycetota bacterium]
MKSRSESVLTVPLISPLQDYLRRNDWQLAALVVALVVVPGAVDLVSGRARGRSASQEDAAVCPPRTIAGRHVRPPRSC